MAMSMVILVSAACHWRGKSGDQIQAPPDDTGDNRGIAEAHLDTEQDVVAYARYCKQMLAIPDVPLAAFNCLDGAEVPMTVDGKRPDHETYEQVRRGEVGCDKPAWLDDAPCANYAFVQKRALTPDVDATLFCRMRSLASHKNKEERLSDYQKEPTFANFRLLYDFESIGLIWTSKKTGHTCFFDFVGKVYGGYVPSPDVTTPPEFTALPEPKPPKELPLDLTPDLVWRKHARTMWRSPAEVVQKDNCVRCHDAGPYKASPYILQVFDVPPHDLALPYIVVGKAFAPWQKQSPLYAVSTTPLPSKDGGPDEPQLCTTCHRMGSERTCKTFLGHAIGQTSSHKLSQSAATFLGRTWMPPAAAAWAASDDDTLNQRWNDAYAKHVDRMICCCANPTAKGCTRQALSVTPLGPPEVGDGPESCL